MPLTGKNLSEWLKSKQTQTRPQLLAVAGQHRSVGASMTAPTAAPMNAPAPQPGWTLAQKPANLPERSVVAGQERIAAMVKDVSQQLFAMEHLTRTALARAEATQDYGQKLNIMRTNANQLAALRAMVTAKAYEAGAGYVVIPGDPLMYSSNDCSSGQIENQVSNSGIHGAKSFPFGAANMCKSGKDRGPAMLTSPVSLVMKPAANPVRPSNLPKFGSRFGL
jgi:hypothetical protein